MLAVKVTISMPQLMSTDLDQRVLFVYAVVGNRLRTGRHLMPTARYRLLRARAFACRQQVTYA